MYRKSSIQTQTGVSYQPTITHKTSSGGNLYFLDRLCEQQRFLRCLVDRKKRYRRRWRYSISQLFPIWVTYEIFSSGDLYSFVVTDSARNNDFWGARWIEKINWFRRRWRYYISQLLPIWDTRRLRKVPYLCTSAPIFGISAVVLQL